MPGLGPRQRAAAAGGKLLVREPNGKIVTLVPTKPLVGLKPVIDEVAAATLKLPALVAVPPGVVTEMGPVAAPTGTVAVI